MSKSVISGRLHIDVSFLSKDGMNLVIRELGYQFRCFVEDLKKQADRSASIPQSIATDAITSEGESVSVRVGVCEEPAEPDGADSLRDSLAASLREMSRRIELTRQPNTPSGCTASPAGCCRDQIPDVDKNCDNSGV